MPKEVPIRDLSIYDPCEGVKSGQQLQTSKISLGRKIYQCKSWYNEFKEMASTPSGQIKIGTTAASPFVGMLLALRSRYRLVKYTSALFTTSVASYVNFPTQTRNFATSVSNTAVTSYQVMARNQSRLFNELKVMPKDDKCDLQSIIDQHQEEDKKNREAAIENEKPAPEKVVPQTNAAHLFQLKDYEEEIVEQEEADLINNEVHDIKEEDTVPDIFMKNPPNEEPIFDFGQSTKEEDTVLDISIKNPTNQEPNFDFGQSTKEEEDTVPEISMTNPETIFGNLIKDQEDTVRDDLTENKKPTLDFGQSIKEDEEMFPARERN